MGLEASPAVCEFQGMGMLTRGCRLDMIFQARAECGFGCTGCQGASCPLERGSPGYSGQPTATS